MKTSVRDMKHEHLLVIVSSRATIRVNSEQNFHVSITISASIVSEFKKPIAREYLLTIMKGVSNFIYSGISRRVFR
jgi:hypothetical protein